MSMDERKWQVRRVEALQEVMTLILTFLPLNFRGVDFPGEASFLMGLKAEIMRATEKILSGCLNFEISAVHVDRGSICEHECAWSSTPRVLPLKNTAGGHIAIDLYLVSESSSKRVYFSYDMAD